MTDSQTPNQGGYDTGRPPIESDNPSAPPPPPPGQPAYPAEPPKRGGKVARVFASVLLLLLISSVVANVYLGGALSALMSGPHEVEYQPGNEEQRITILPIEGMINDKTVEFVRSSLQTIKKKDDKPKAIILRVASGGGGVTASDQILHHIKQFKKETDIPVVASFGSAAASGGYYVSMASDHIVAEPTTTTGSIGVIAPAFTIDKMLEKIGVTPEVIVAEGSPLKDEGNDITRPWDEQDRQVWQHRLNAAHQQFVEVVIEGRAKGNDDLNESKVPELAKGQTFTAAEAQANHLVDEVGYMDRAIAKAKALGGIDENVTPRVTQIKQPQSLLWSVLLGRQQSSSLAELDGQKLRSMLHEIKRRELMYLSPFGP